MHKILVFFALHFVCFQIASAANIIIKGFIEKPTSETVVLVYEQNTLDYIDKKKTRIEVPVDNKNNFRFSFESDCPVQFYLQNGKNYLIFQVVAFPGDSNSLNFYKNKIEIEGNSELELAYELAIQDRFYRSDAYQNAAGEARKKLSPSDYANLWKDLRNQFHADLDTYSKSNSVKSDFINYLKQSIDYYSYGINLVKAPKGNGRPALLDSAYFSYLYVCKLNDKTALGNSDYLYFIRNLMYYKWLALFSQDGQNNAGNSFQKRDQYDLRDSIARLYFTDEVLQYAYYINDNEQIRNLISFHKGKPNFDSLYKTTFDRISISSKKYTDPLLLLRTIENLRSSNISLRPASDFEVKDLNGKIHKLSDYRGKVVYLDFWSTTCAPCIAEIPALNALIEKYQGRDVVFLSVAFDSNHDRLNRFLAKKPINGTVLVEEKGFGSKVAGDYQIQSIPRYCVIDKVGNLLNDNAPRPSSKPDDIIDAALMH